MKKIITLAILLLISTGCTTTKYVTPNVKGVKCPLKKVPKCGDLKLIKHKYTYEIPIKQGNCVKEVLEVTAYNQKVCKKSNETNLKIINEACGKGLKWENY